MSTPPQQNYQEKMYGLRTNYLQRLKKNLRDIRRLRELLLKDLAPLKDLQQASILANNLTGSGATFGFPNISQSAGELYQNLKFMIDASLSSKGFSKEKKELITSIDLFYEASRLAIHQNNLDDTQGKNSTAKSSKKESEVIGILSRKQNIVNDEISYLSAQGYKVIYADSLANLESTEDMSVAIISDDVSSADERIFNDLLLQERKIDLKVPFIFHLTNDDFKSRLRALRLGAQTSFADTMSGKKIDEILYHLIKLPSVDNQPHIFVAVKDETLGGLYEHLLQQAGMRVTLLKNAKDPLKTMLADPGDLILVDFTLSFCTGSEFVQIVKQTPGLSDLRILFKSTIEEYQSLEIKPDIETLLLKPFTPDQLIQLIKYNINKVN